MKKNDPIVSIVLPTYNGERWLEESINSIRKQTEDRWELIIVNDCSTDSSLEIARCYSKNDPRIIIVNNEINKKLPASLNIGFSMASGKYLTWTSDDNRYKKDALSKMVCFLERHPEVDLVSMSSDVIDSEGEIIGSGFDEGSVIRSPAGLLISNNVGAAFMYRREVRDRIGDYCVNKFCVEDYDYWMRITLESKATAYLDDKVYEYRVHEGSLSSTKKKKIRRMDRLLKKEYAKDFFIKFDYTFWDKTKFWSQFNLFMIPFLYVIPVCLCKAYKGMAELAIFVCFRDKEHRKKVRRKVFRMGGYSFELEK